MEHTLRNFSKKTLGGFCLTCDSLTTVVKIGKNYVCSKQPLWATKIELEIPRIKKVSNFDPVYSHGLTKSETAAMKEGKCCAICGQSEIKQLRVDHCHTTMVIRGVLCNDCNLGIARFKDDPDLLRAAIRYLDTAPAA